MAASCASQRAVSAATSRASPESNCCAWIQKDTERYSADSRTQALPSRLKLKPPHLKRQSEPTPRLEEEEKKLPRRDSKVSQEGGREDSGATRYVFQRGRTPAPALCVARDRFAVHRACGSERKVQTRLYPSVSISVSFRVSLPWTPSCLKREGSLPRCEIALEFRTLREGSSSETDARSEDRRGAKKLSVDERPSSLCF